MRVGRFAERVELFEIPSHRQIGFGADARESVAVLEISARAIAAHPCRESLRDAVGLIAPERGRKQDSSKTAQVRRATARKRNRLRPRLSGSESRPQELNPSSSSGHTRQWSD